MKERPILFSCPMVRAILNGRKTQTRRVVKPQPTQPYPWYNCADGVQFWTDNPQQGEKGKPELRKVPYGIIGDRLWVRETFVLERWDDEPKPPDDRPLFHQLPKDEDCEHWLWPYYKATDPKPELCDEDDEDDAPKCKWILPRFMPRWASRIMLEIVNVHVERLQEISESDALAEGIIKNGDFAYFIPGSDPTREGDEYFQLSALKSYRRLWDSINGKTFPWSSNPWVWVVEFKQYKEQS